MRVPRYSRAIIVLAALAACGREPTGPQPGDNALIISSAAGPQTLLRGDSAQLVVHDSAGTASDPATFTWTSSVPGVVGVTAPGRVRALAVGAALVHAFRSGLDVTFDFTVSDAASLDLVPATATIPVGGTVQLDLVVLDAAGERIHPNWEWHNRNTAVVHIDGPLTMVGLSPGTAWIVAKVHGADLVDSSLITVVPAEVTAMKAWPDSATIAVGDTITPFATLTDSGGKQVWKDATWTSRSPDVAAVTAGGRVTGVGAGAATLVASYLNLSDSVVLHVSSTRLAFVQVVTGAEFSCGLTAGGAAYCWGRNDYGQLGRATPVQCSSDYAPYRVACSPFPVPVSGGKTFASLAAGAVHACGLTAAGATWCWGSNKWFELTAFVPSRSTPGAITGLGAMAGVSADHTHDCALSTAGRVWCWGSSYYGEAGAPLTSSYPFQVTLDTAARAVATAPDHSCALTTDGRTFCWGRNDVGQLGSTGGDLNCLFGAGSVPCTATPRLVSGGFTFDTIAANTGFNCGLASRQAFCWGIGWYRRLSTDTASSSVPVPVAGDLRFDQVSVGFEIACGLTDTEALYCWGRHMNTFGDGSSAMFDTFTPLRAGGDRAYSQVATGFEHTCALAADGGAWCWGRNWQGQVGNGHQALGSYVLGATRVIGGS